MQASMQMTMKCKFEDILKVLLNIYESLDQKQNFNVIDASILFNSFNISAGKFTYNPARLIYLSVFNVNTKLRPWKNFFFLNNSTVSDKYWAINIEEISPSPKINHFRTRSVNITIPSRQFIEQVLSYSISVILNLPDLRPIWRKIKIKINISIHLLSQY